jgi:hypothetical protein
MDRIAKRRLAFAAAVLGAAVAASIPAQASRNGHSSRGPHAQSHPHHHHHPRRHHHAVPSYRSAPAVTYYAPRVVVVPRPMYVAPAYVAPAYVPPPAYVVPTPPAAVVPPPPAPSAGTWRTIPGPFLALDGASFVAGGVTYVLSGLRVFDVSTPQGAAARDRLQQLLSSGAAQVWRIAVDGYGRSVARVVVNGADLAVRLRQEGCAAA